MHDEAARNVPNRRSYRRENSPPHARPTTAAGATRGSSPPRAEIEKVFRQLDRNKDGIITRREWDAAYEPQRTFDKLDVNHDGVVSREEFVRAHSPPPERPPPVSYHASRRNDDGGYGGGYGGGYETPSDGYGVREERERMTNVLNPTQPRITIESLDEDDAAVEAITVRMKSVEDRLTRRQARAVAEKAKVDQVSGDLERYRHAKGQASHHATEFQATAKTLERSCKSLDREFQAIMQRATTLRDSLNVT